MRIPIIVFLALALTVAPLLVREVHAQETADIVDTAVQAGGFDTLVAAVEAAGLVDTLKGEGPFTVFAPTDEAFAALPEGTVETLLDDPEGMLTDILLYHVVSGKVMAADVVELDGADVETVGGDTILITVDGETVGVNDATVVVTDIETSNGVIHVIDTVLIPPTGEESAAQASSASSEYGAGDIVDTAIEAGSFNTLIAAVQAAGLEETLRGEGPFTVFAPTDDAFAAIPADLLESLLADPSGALTDILLYHVVAGEVLATDLVNLNGETVETVGGESFLVTIDGDSVKVNDANVIATDIQTSNGIVHVLDRVILPPSIVAVLQAGAPAQAEPEKEMNRATRSSNQDRHGTKRHRSSSSQGGYCR